LVLNSILKKGRDPFELDGVCIPAMVFASARINFLSPVIPVVPETVVNPPVDGVSAPTVASFIAPPVMVTLCEIMLAIVAMFKKVLDLSKDGADGLTFQCNKNELRDFTSILRSITCELARALSPHNVAVGTTLTAYDQSFPSRLLLAARRTSLSAG